MQSSLRTVVGVLLLVATAGGCGAKTGLILPDALNQPPDAEVPNPCVILEPDVPIIVDLGLEANVQIADVFFLVDVTGSMYDEIDNIQASLQNTIVPGIAARIPDVAFGVAIFSDFPVDPYGAPGDVPYELRLPISRDLVAVQGALDRLPRHNGLDGPESQVEALYQTATGEGIRWPGGEVPPSAGCPSGGSGYPCFRRDALPVIVLLTDAPFHNDGSVLDPYTFIPDAHRFDQAIDELVALGIRLIGINSGEAWYNGRDDLQAASRATGSLDASGRPLVFDIAVTGLGLGTQVVSAVNTLATDVRIDVDAREEDVPGDAVDTRLLVHAIRPVRAQPSSGFDSFDATTFYEVVPGTRLVFELEIRNDGVVIPGPVAQVFPVRIVFRGDRRFRLGARIVDIVIGPDGSLLCRGGGGP